MPLDPLRFSDPIVRVYEACVDELLLNLARHFNIKAAGITGSFRYDVELLAKLGAIRRESAAIIARHVKDNEPMIRLVVEKSMLEALADVEPELAQAAKNGLLDGAEMDVSEGIANTLQAYENQARDRLNLVNASMLDGAVQTFRAGVLSAQDVLNAQTGKVVIGVSTLQQAVKKAVVTMRDAGVTGFTDASGRKWSAEAYVRTVIKTTCSNAANRGVLDRNQQYGNDLIWVRTNATARPGCYPWQGKVISMENRARSVTDGDGKTVRVYAAGETTYGQPDGIYGVNCHHGPMNVFIPGASFVRAAKVDKETSDEGYRLTQEQRRLERAVRYAKRDAAMLEAAGADRDAIDRAKLRIRVQQKKVRELIAAHPDRLVRDYSREAIYN